MSADLEALQASISRLLAEKNRGNEANAKALLVAMQGVQAALTEVMALSERETTDEDKQIILAAADRIAQAVSQIKMQAPDVTVAAPVVNVEAPQVHCQFEVPESPPPRVHNQINVQPADVKLQLAAGDVTMTFKFNYTGPYISGGTATITRNPA